MEFNNSFEIKGSTTDWLQCLDPLVCLRECEALKLDTSWVGKPNRVDMVRGKNPGKAYLLIPLTYLKELKIIKDDPDAPNDGLPHFLPGDGQDDFSIRVTCQVQPGNASPFPNNPDSATNIFQKFYFIQAVSLIPGGTPDDWEPFLCEFADIRVLGQLTSIEARYNVRAVFTKAQVDAIEVDDTKPSYEACSAKDGDGYETYSYLEILNDIGVNLPGIFDVADLFEDDDFPADTTPENIRYEGVSAWEAFNHFLGQSGLSLALAQDGTFFKISKFADEDSVSSIADLPGNTRRHVTRTIEGIKSVIPEKVRVFFPKEDHGCGGDEGGGTLTPIDSEDQKQSCSDLFWSKDVTSTTVYSTLSGKVQIGTVFPLHDYTLFARYSDIETSDDPINQSELEDRATAKATAFLGSIYKVPNSADILLGIWNIYPSATVQRVSMYDFGDGVFTQVYYGFNDVFVPYPKMNHYVHPREYLSPNSLKSDDYELEPDIRGITGCNLRLIDLYVDATTDPDNPALKSPIQKEILVNGSIIGICRLPDVKLAGTKCADP